MRDFWNPPRGKSRIVVSR